ncbi:M20/M25/M40 family metallo-hydrolase [Deinococcus frigens]|uniref:M20/M25/M40 family metallo-hydrolase n=3 Tax=Deinococcus frigens TaxID=249403 RepID=UPI00068BFAEB|nr:M20/M25/M40 family metallo-hydrolase [Deinococcus frigens]
MSQVAPHRVPSPGSPDPWLERTHELAITLTRWASVTGSAGETAFGGRLEALLRTWPTFAARPGDVWLSPARHGYAAQNVYGLVPGRSARTLLLSGHYDTVETGDYGEWQPLACEPETLSQAVAAALARLPDPTAAEALTVRDLAGGDFLMGRGLLDMKGGLAAGLAVLERYAALPLRERPGHLLLVATPDEEGRSSGARAVAHDLPALALGRSLDVVAGINLDATADTGDGNEGRAVYLGTVGKVLVSALVIGRAAHAAYPFDGLSATLLAAALISRIEAAPELADAAHGEASAPPVCLELRDGKTAYDVTSPGQVWCAFNMLTQGRTPGAVLAQFVAVAQAAASDALAEFAARAAAAHSPNAAALAGAQAEVLTFGELRGRAVTRAGEEAVRRVQDGPAGPNPLADSREIMAALTTLAGLTGPAVVLGFGALHYPATHLAGHPHDHALLGAAQSHAADLSRQTGQSLRLRHAFPGISDMSFLGQPADDATEQVLARHTAHPAHIDPAPPDALRFPVVNIGPWGRDYHQPLERVHVPYSFGVVPELLWRVTHTVLGAGLPPD